MTRYITAIGLLLVTRLALATPESLPAFSTDPDDWINSPPLTTGDLRGKVVLLDVWTFGCGNCLRSLPWLKQVEEKFADRPFRVIGIHTPEFPWEKLRLAVESRVESLGIKHPVMMDNDFTYWNALNNRYWPAFYLADENGRIQGLMIGELHIGDDRALEVEAAIEKLLQRLEAR